MCANHPEKVSRRLLPDVREAVMLGVPSGQPGRDLLRRTPSGRRAGDQAPPPLPYDTPDPPTWALRMCPPLSFPVHRSLPRSRLARAGAGSGHDSRGGSHLQRPVRQGLDPRRHLRAADYHRLSGRRAARAAGRHPDRRLVVLHGARGLSHRAQTAGWHRRRRILEHPQSSRAPHRLSHGRGAS